MEAGCLLFGCHIVTKIEMSCSLNRYNSCYILSFFVFCRSFVTGDGANYCWSNFEASKVCIGPVTNPDQTHVVYIVSVFLTLMFLWMLRDTDPSTPSRPTEGSPVLLCIIRNTTSIYRNHFKPLYLFYWYVQSKSGLSVLPDIYCVMKN